MSEMTQDGQTSSEFTFLFLSFLIQKTLCSSWDYFFQHVLVHYRRESLRGGGGCADVKAVEEAEVR